MVTARRVSPGRASRGPARRVFRAEEKVAVVTDAESADWRVGFSNSNDGGTFNDIVVAPAQRRL